MYDGNVENVSTSPNYRTSTQRKLEIRYFCSFLSGFVFSTKIFFLVSGDYEVPSGATVIIATYKLHRLSHIYPNPDTFDPDNFLPERQANRHYYAFVPFSAGPRSCVGKKRLFFRLIKLE